MNHTEKAQEAEAITQLMRELNVGIRSAEQNGWISEDEFHEHFRNKKNETL